MADPYLNAESRKRFKSIYIEITNQCDRACAFCPGTERPAASMDARLFRLAVDQAAPLAEKIYPHVLGEPLAHPEFPSFVSYCAAAGMPMAVTTNGTHIAGSAGEALMNPIVSQINFSLHGLDPAVQGDRRIFDSILDFVDRALSARPGLYLNLRLWNLGRRDDPVARQGNSFFLGKIEERFGLIPGSAGAPNTRKSRRLAGRLYLHSDTLFEWPDGGSVSNGIQRPGEGDARGTCRALDTHCGILADGTVVPCCLDRNGAIPLGNIMERSLGDILASPRAQAMEDGFARGELVETLCRGCGYRRRFG